MKKLVKEFIESNIELIEDKEYYDDLYDQAYEWLPDDYVTELTTILSEAIGDDFSRYAKENIKKHINLGILSFAADKHNDISLESFVRVYMNHINGIDWDEFVILAEQVLENSNLIKVYDDGVGNLFIARR